MPITGEALLERLEDMLSTSEGLKDADKGWLRRNIKQMVVQETESAATAVKRVAELEAAQGKSTKKLEAQIAELTTRAETAEQEAGSLRTDKLFTDMGVDAGNRALIEAYHRVHGGDKPLQEWLETDAPGDDVVARLLPVPEEPPNPDDVVEGTDSAGGGPPAAPASPPAPVTPAPSRGPTGARPPVKRQQITAEQHQAHHAQLLAQGKITEAGEYMRTHMLGGG